MGLDIAAYEGLTKNDSLKFVDGDVFNQQHEIVDIPDNALIAFINPAFPERARDIEDRCIYNAVDRFSFKAGSYSGYNRWREMLAKLAGYPETRLQINGTEQSQHAFGAWIATAGPFWELINFSDNEGIIGTSASKKLSADFATFDDAARAVGEAEFYQLFQLWQRAFDMAARDGAVNFV